VSGIVADTLQQNQRLDHQYSNNPTMEVVTSYATSGDYELVPKVFRFFQELYPTRRTVAIPTHDALAIVHHLLPVLEGAKDTSGWYILWALSSLMLNSNGSAFLDALQNLPCCDDILNWSWQLRRIARDRFEIIIVTRVISEFVNGCASRQRMVFQYPDIIRGIVLAVETETTVPVEKVDHLESMLATSALVQIVRAIKPNPISATDDVRYDFLDVFLRYNGFHALCLALDYTVLCSDKFVDHNGENKQLELCALAVQTLLLILLRWQPPHLESALCTLDRNARFRMNVTTYNALTIRAAPQTRAALCTCSLTYVSYVQSMWDGDALQECLLFTPPRGQDGEPLVAHLVTLMRQFDIGGTGGTRFILQSWAILPAVAEVLGRLDPPELRLQSRCCAFPGCDVCEEWESATMKKCGRCKAVYYCGAAHQQAHWPEHKRDCKKAER
jgi:hypothetical protein